jgi:hypothetical protein
VFEARQITGDSWLPSRVRTPIQSQQFRSFLRRSASTNNLSNQALAQTPCVAIKVHSQPSHHGVIILPACSFFPAPRTSFIIAAVECGVIRGHSLDIRADKRKAPAFVGEPRDIFRLGYLKLNGSLSMLGALAPGSKVLFRLSSKSALVHSGPSLNSLAKKTI